MRVVGEVAAQSWDRPGRPRDASDPQLRLRWEIATAASSRELEGTLPERFLTSA
jgi:hypothetical protein